LRSIQHRRLVPSQLIAAPIANSAPCDESTFVRRHTKIIITAHHKPFDIAD